jgi:hypothetical protein
MMLGRKQLSGLGVPFSEALNAGGATAFRDFCHIKQQATGDWRLATENLGMLVPDKEGFRLLPVACRL